MKMGVFFVIFSNWAWFLAYILAFPGNKGLEKKHTPGNATLVCVFLGLPALLEAAVLGRHRNTVVIF